jgi:hypothetical protein
MKINFNGTSLSVCTVTIPANVFNAAHSICCWIYLHVFYIGFGFCYQVSWATQAAVGIDLGVNSLLWNSSNWKFILES